MAAPWLPDLINPEILVPVATAPVAHSADRMVPPGPRPAALALIVLSAKIVPTGPIAQTAVTALSGAQGLRAVIGLTALSGGPALSALKAVPASADLAVAQRGVLTLARSGAQRVVLRVAMAATAMRGGRNAARKTASSRGARALDPNAGSMVAPTVHPVPMGAPVSAAPSATPTNSPPVPKPRAPLRWMT